MAERVAELGRASSASAASRACCVASSRVCATESLSSMAAMAAAPSSGLANPLLIRALRSGELSAACSSGAVGGSDEGHLRGARRHFLSSSLISSASTMSCCAMARLLPKSLHACAIVESLGWPERMAEQWHVLPMSSPVCLSTMWRYSLKSRRLSSSASSTSMPPSQMASRPRATISVTSEFSRSESSTAALARRKSPARMQTLLPTSRFTSWCTSVPCEVSLSPSSSTSAWMSDAVWIISAMTASL
mmetsp:Transcript_31453/g.67623  ORF Transcript_31453/g.67623 Transcript_31453/m.67623 type:complete len:248 (-) Transcript_31453:367-1110(-)